MEEIILYVLIVLYVFAFMVFVVITNYVFTNFFKKNDDVDNDRYLDCCNYGCDYYAPHKKLSEMTDEEVAEFFGVSINESPKLPELSDPAEKPKKTKKIADKKPSKTKGKTAKKVTPKKTK
jgi:hypothetical protein